MKEKCIKIFRDIPSSFLLIIGFCLTMFVTMKLCGFVNKVSGNKLEDKCYKIYYMNFAHSEIITEENNERRYKYVDSSSQWVSFEDVYNIMNENKLNFYINYMEHIGESQEIQRNVTYIYNFDDTYPFEYKKKMKINSKNKPVVVIGESIVDYTRKIGDGYYLNIEGDYYEVAGITVNNEVGEYDSSIYFISDYVGNEKYYKDAEYDFETSVMSASEYCVYAYSEDEEIYCWIMKEISPLIVIAMTVTIVVKILTDLVMNNGLVFNYRILYDAFIIIGSVIITLLITSIGAYRYSGKIIPAEVLKEL